jgi:lipoprotein-anchoring transpeptidase ErfK/SrfK
MQCEAIMKATHLILTLLLLCATLGAPAGALAAPSNMPPAGSSAVTDPYLVTVVDPNAATGLRFVVSISKQTCWLYRGNTVQYRWTCSTGRKGSATLTGNFKVRSKMARAYGGTWNWWLPYWLGIYMAGRLENGIHGLPYSAKTGKKFWGPQLGTPTSYGCVVLSDTAAKALYNVAYVGMPVIIQR